MEPEPFKRISIPLVRRIYPQLIANKIMSVQPLMGPTGLQYYLRFRYQQHQETRKKMIRPKKYRSIDDSWEQQ